MKKSIFLILATILTATNAWADWCGNSFITVNGLWCTGSNGYVHDGGKFDGKDLGELTVLDLGGELQVYPKSEEAATMYYSIDNAEAVAISLPKTAEEGNNSIHSGSAKVDLSTLAAGEHTLAVWFNHGSDWDSNDNKNFVATFSTPEAIVYKDVTYTIQCAGFTGAPKITWWGANGLENSTEPQKMDSLGYNKWSYTFAQIDSTTGVNFYIELAGFQSKTIKIHESNKITYFYTILQDVVVKGSFDDWKDGVQLTTKSNKDHYQTISGVVQLDAEKTYEFKLVVNEEWRGGNIQITKDAPTASFAGGGDNAKITTDLKGGYTFTYNYLTKELTVTYPYTGTLDLGELSPYYGDEGVSLSDDNYNNVEIFNLQDEEYKFGNDFDVKASIKHNGNWLDLYGKASWTLADGVMTLNATNMVDENNTVYYTITATALAPVEKTITCNGQYEIVNNGWSLDSTFVGVTEDTTVTVTISTNEEGTEVFGDINEEEIIFDQIVSYSVTPDENNVLILAVVAKDGAGNTYNVTITATPIVYSEVYITNATVLANEDGMLTLSGKWDENNITCDYYAPMWAPDEYVADIYSEDYTVYLSCATPTYTQDGEHHTISGLFIPEYGEKYIITITTKANVSTDVENVETTATLMKMIQNGQLIIIKNGVQYNAQGAVVK